MRESVTNDDDVIIISFSHLFLSLETLVLVIRLFSEALQ